MKLEKRCFVKSVIFMLALVIFLPGIQGIKQEDASYSGAIKSVDKDFKSIVVNNVKVLISDNTKIVDEKRNILRTNDLKPGLSVTIEGVPGSSGFFAKKIVILTPKK